MKPEYLFGVTRQPSSFPNIEIIGDGMNTWYAAAYDVVKADSFRSTKREIVDYINQAMHRNTQTRDYDWHHVVETQHISQFVLSSLVYQEKLFNMPTILIHKPEHRFFSQNFNNNDFRELTDIGKGTNTSISTQVLSNPTRKAELRTKIEDLKLMYNHMYQSYPTLRKIANNVFNYHFGGIIG